MRLVAGIRPVQPGEFTLIPQVSSIYERVKKGQGGIYGNEGNRKRIGEEWEGGEGREERWTPLQNPAYAVVSVEARPKTILMHTLASAGKCSWEQFVDNKAPFP